MSVLKGIWTYDLFDALWILELSFTGVFTSLVENKKVIKTAKRVKQVLTNSKVKQTNTNPSSEQHRKVCCVAKIRFVVRFSQLHVAVFGEVEDYNEHGPDILRAYVDPGARVCNPRHPTLHFCQRDSGFCRAPYYKGPNNCSRHKGDHRVDSNMQRKSSKFLANAKPTESRWYVFLHLHFSLQCLWFEAVIWSTVLRERRWAKNLSQNVWFVDFL